MPRVLVVFCDECTQTGAVIADERDLDIVKGFGDELLKTSRVGTSAQVLDYYEKVLKPLADGTKELTCDQIQAKYLEVCGRILHRDILTAYNNTLQDLGLVELTKDLADRRRTLIRVR